MSLYCHVFGNVPATYPLTHHVNPPPSLQKNIHLQDSYQQSVLIFANLEQPRSFFKLHVIIPILMFYHITMTYALWFI